MTSRTRSSRSCSRPPRPGGKAPLVSCVIGWNCEEVNAAQVEGYGLSDHIEIIAPGDGAALNADLIGAYEKGEPWLGYQWGTNGPALVLDLVRLTEPEYSAECWFTTKACAYQDATILIAAHPDVVTKAPDVVSVLRAWTFDIEQYKDGGRLARGQPGRRRQRRRPLVAQWQRGRVEHLGDQGCSLGHQQGARRRRNPGRLARGRLGPKD